MRNSKLLKFLFILLLSVCTFAQGENEDYYRAGVNYYLDGDMEKAESALSKAFEKYPENKKAASLYAEVLVIIAGKHFENKDYEKAFKYIEKARKLKPENEKILNVYKMLDEKLHPGKYEVKKPAEMKKVFSEIKNRRNERIKIIQSPPKKLTIKEKELLRPIVIAYNDHTDNNFIVYFFCGVAFIFIVSLIIVSIWIRQIVTAGIENIGYISKISDEKVRQMEKEIKELKAREKEIEAEQNIKQEKNSRDLMLREERLKKEYYELLRESLKSNSRPRKVPEPELPESGKKENEIELKKSFNNLKKTNYNAAVSLLKNLSVSSNAWIRLWAAELSIEIEAEDAIHILKNLAADSQYQVKKTAIRSLKFLKDRKNIPENSRSLINNIISEIRREGWVV